MKSVSLLIATLLVATSSFSQGALAADANTMVLRNGTLAVSGDMNAMRLSLNGKKVRESDGFSMSIEKKFAIGETDAVLLTNNSGGNACPAQYFFALSTKEGIKLSPDFGTCSDIAKSTQVGNKVIVTMPKMGSKGSAKYTLENGVVTENGKPVK